MPISPVNPGGFSTPAAGTTASTPSLQAAVPSTSVQPSVPVELSNAVPSTAALPKLDQLKNAVEQVNKVVQTMTNDVRFTLDKDTGIHVVKVVDTKTDEVIRQYPSEELIDLARSLDKLRGLIIRETA
jgi:flagellar protein FlaG